MVWVCCYVLQGWQSRRCWLWFLQDTSCFDNILPCRSESCGGWTAWRSLDELALLLFPWSDNQWSSINLVSILMLNPKDYLHLPLHPCSCTAAFLGPSAPLPSTACHTQTTISSPFVFEIRVLLLDKIDNSGARWAKVNLDNIFLALLARRHRPSRHLHTPIPRRPCRCWTPCSAAWCNVADCCVLLPSSRHTSLQANQDISRKLYYKYINKKS